MRSIRLMLRRLLSRPLAAAIVCVFAGPAWAAGELAGASAEGTADYLYQPCVSFACEPASGNWSSGSDGGPGSTFASVAGPGGVDATLAYSAVAQFDASTSLPVLGAYAAATTQFGTHPGYSSDCCYLNSASASAQGVQYFTYSGPATTTYTLEYTVDGIIAGVSGGVDAGLTIYDGTTGNLELPFGNFIDGSFVSLSASEVQGPFSGSGSVSVTLDPGEGFYLSAFILVNVPREGDAVVDASNTLHAQFTSGDVSLLTPTLVAAAIPEPDVWMLMAGALVMLGVVRRRQGRRPG